MFHTCRDISLEKEKSTLAPFKSVMSTALRGSVDTLISMTAEGSVVNVEVHNATRTQKIGGQWRRVCHFARYHRGTLPVSVPSTKARTVVPVVVHVEVEVREKNIPHCFLPLVLLSPLLLAHNAPLRPEHERPS